MGKYYAVRKGRETGIFETWDECSQQVIGYKGAEFKKFTSLYDAKTYIKNGVCLSKVYSPDKIKENEMIAYVDGSYNDQTKVVGYGVVIFTVNGKKRYQGTASMETVGHRNVSGEIEGALFAMRKAIELNKEKLILHFDYAGIEKWAHGDWRTNHPLTKSYKKEFNKINNVLDVIFIKVKAHSGDVYNDEADQLAKEACGIEI